MWNRHYILKNKIPVEAKNLEEWAEWFGKPDENDRIVKQEHVGPYWISTVFLSLDHNWSRKGPPVLWETMVFKANPNAGKTIQFGGIAMKEVERIEEVDFPMTRCSGSWEQAEAMHER